MSKFQLNKTLATIAPSGIRKFFEIVAEMPDVISLSVGEPDFAAPWHIAEAAIHALENGETHYTGNRGTPELRAAIADYLQERFHVQYAPDTEILITNGASEAFDIAVRACLNPGDEVLIPEPSYVMYAPLITLAGGIPVAIPVTAKMDWKVTAKEVAKRITPRTKSLILNYPSNPTGTTLTKVELTTLAKLIAKHNLLVISDEIYAELTYAGRHTAFASLTQMKERTITISGFSKAWALTGLRLGYLAAPAMITAAATKIHQYSALCANSVSQVAALEALRNGKDTVKQMRSEYQSRRDFCIRELRRLGLTTTKPDGAFYLFPNVKRKTGLSGDDFALQLLKRAKVAVVPGSAFGTNCNDHVRISYATNLKELTEAFGRIEQFIKKH